jgi:KUP system potassium uptake protein
MVSIVALIIWKLPSYVVLAGFLVFGTLDTVYLSSALTKVPDGAWFTLCLAVILSSVFILWRFGKEQQWRAEASDRFPPSHMLIPSDSDNSSSASSGNRGLKLTPYFGGAAITPIKGIGVFFDKTGQPSTTPTVFVHFLQKFLAASDIVVFFHLRPLSTPTVPPEERYTVTHCFSSPGSTTSPMPRCFRLVIRHGYTDEVITRDLGLLVYEQIRNFVIREGTARARLAAAIIESQFSQNDSNPPPTSSSAEKQKLVPYTTESDLVSSHLRNLQNAYDDQVVYIVGKEQLRIKEGTNYFWSVALWAFLWMRENTRSKVSNLNVETGRLVEVGFVKDV